MTNPSAALSMARAIDAFVSTFPVQEIEGSVNLPGELDAVCLVRAVVHGFHHQLDR